MGKRRWEVWQRQDGSTYLVWGTKKHPEEAETLVSTLFSENWISAQRDAFGEEAEIDEAIEPLVSACEQFGGCMTTHACQGHVERDDDCGIIGLVFDDPLCFKAFYEALDKTALPNGLSWHLRLDEEHILDIPPEALAFELVLALDVDGVANGVPDPEALLEFAKNLLTTWLAFARNVASHRMPPN